MLTDGDIDHLAEAIRAELDGDPGPQSAARRAAIRRHLAAAVRADRPKSPDPGLDASVAFLRRLLGEPDPFDAPCDTHVRAVLDALDAAHGLLADALGEASMPDGRCAYEAGAVDRQAMVDAWLRSAPLGRAGAAGLTWGYIADCLERDLGRTHAPPPPAVSRARADAAVAAIRYAVAALEHSDGLGKRYVTPQMEEALRYLRKALDADGGGG